MSEEINQGQKYRKRPVVITAQQFLEGEPIPKGVCFGWRCGGDPSEPHVHTIHENQRVDVVFSDWIIPEPDGEHYYPVKDDIFWRTYEPVSGNIINGPAELRTETIARLHYDAALGNVTELLTACKGLLVCIGSFAHTGTYPTPEEPEIIQARAAIAKTEGRV